MSLCGCGRRAAALLWRTALVDVRSARRCYSAVSGLAEFFDKQDNWGKMELSPVDNPGRSWTVDELRGKSNSDLHKLWYVLLKERNMLMTMQYQCERKTFSFPNPERIDFVEESMSRLENVVGERNAAALQLEKGDDGRPPQRTVTSMAGFRQSVPLREHLVPSHMNVDPKRRPQFEQPDLSTDARVFQQLWREKRYFLHQRRREDRLRAKGRLRHYYKCESETPKVDVTPPEYD